MTRTSYLGLLINCYFHFFLLTDFKLKSSENEARVSAFVPLRKLVELNFQRVLLSKRSVTPTEFKD
jgi:hypothetical protein